MSKKYTGRKERRQHKRYRAKSGTIAFKDQAGEIIDISMGGLAFSYVEREDWSPSGMDCAMLLGERDLRLDEIQMKVISDCAISSGVSVIRRCGVKFEKLTPRQLAQLEYFIWANTSARDEEAAPALQDE